MTRDGATIPVSLTISPVLTTDGELIGMSRIARDISAQQALQREAFRLAAIVDSSDDATAARSASRAPAKAQGRRSPSACR